MLYLSKKNYSCIDYPDAYQKIVKDETKIFYMKAEQYTKLKLNKEIRDKFIDLLEINEIYLISLGEKKPEGYYENSTIELVVEKEV